MLEINLQIKKEDFDKAFGNEIKAKIKNIVRNSPDIEAMVENSALLAISRAVAKLPLEKMVREDMDIRIKNAIKEVTGDERERIKNDVAMQLLGMTYAEAMDRKNRETIVSLFSKEIDLIKGSNK